MGKLALVASVLVLFAIQASGEDTLRFQAVETALRLGLPLDNEVLDALQHTIAFARAERGRDGAGAVRIDNNARYLTMAFALIPQRFLEGHVAFERQARPRVVTMSSVLRPVPLTTYTGVGLSFFSPSSGPLTGGTTVNFIGVNFKPGVTVSFGGVPSPSVIWNSCTFISAVAPAGSGAVGITITNPDGPSVMAGSNFTYTSPAAQTVFVTGVSPAAGPALGGTSITIHGSNFASPATVTFIFQSGATASASSIVVPTSDTITAVTPAGQAGPASVLVGTNGQSIRLSGSYFFNPPNPAPPTITSLGSSSGAQGTSLTINGTNFTNPMTVAFRTPDWTLNVLTFPTVTTSVAPSSSTQLTVTIPSRAMTGPIQVSNQFGAAATCDIFTVLPLGPPTISSIAPPSGGTGTPNQGGAVISVTGSNFVNVTEVLLNGQEEPFSVSNSSLLSVIVTAPSSSGPITVKTQGGGLAVSGSTFSVVPMTYCEGNPPSVSGISASAFDPGAVGTITGFNFTTFAATYFPGDSLPFSGTGTSGGGTSVSIIASAGAMSGTPLVVTDYGAAVAPYTTINGTAPPTITSLSSSTANRGTQITINGTNLNNIAEARFGGLVMGIFNSSPASLQFRIPPGTSSGGIVLEGPAGSVTSPNLTLTCNAPSISSFPAAAATGRAMSIAGQNLTGSNADSSIAVFFGGIRAPSATPSVVGTSVSTTVPAGAPKAPITVQTLYGSATTATNFNPLGSTKGDFDFDFRSDVIFRHQGAGNVVQWIMNGAFLTTVNVLGSVDPAYHIEGTGDFDGNGRADLVWRAPASGNVVIWLMSGSTLMRSVLVGSVATSYHIEGVGDLDGDGKSDIVWRNSTTGDVVLWLMTGATVTSVTDLGPVDPSAHIEAIGDLNADGWADFVWRNVSTGAVTVWLCKGDFLRGSAGPYVTTSASPGSMSTAYHIEGAGDFNADGRDDLVFRNGTTGDAVMWLMSGTAILGGAVPLGGVSTDFLIEGVSDFNGDGKADLLWRGQSSGTVVMWIMNGGAVTSVTLIGSVDTNYHIESPTPR